MSECMGTDRPHIQILLSTYNGEKYLREQLDSFLAQENFQDCSVLIRDDGSTDGTRVILQEYKRIKGFEICFGENWGVTKSYWWLLEHSDNACEYFAISDQDDIWLPEKLKSAIKAIETKNMDVPILFASLSQIVDKDLVPMGSTLRPGKAVGYYNAMVQNVLPGHTQVMNRRLRDALLLHGASGIHAIDWWFYLVASAIGEICFLDAFTVLHRQHGNNRVGYGVSLLQKTRQKFHNLRDGKANAISVQLADFYQRYGPDMPEEYRVETQRYFHSMLSGMGRIRYALTSRAYRQSSIDSLLFRILYMLGKYNFSFRYGGIVQ